jgi:steroid delta-isomerase-like uncharacterized protein
MTITAVHPDDPAYAQSYGAAWGASPDEFRAFLSPDVVYVEAGMQMTYEGIDATIAFQQFMLRFSSDSVIEFTSFLRDDDQFAAEWVWSGTATGRLRLGDDLVDARGSSYSVEGVAVGRFDDSGLVVHHKDYYDVRRLVAQLGPA